MVKRLIGTIFLVLAVYGVVKAMPLIEGPSIFVYSPENNETFSDGIVVVRGKSERVAIVTLNGVLLLRDQNGDFSSTLTFPFGGSILTLTATDRFGRTVTETRSIFVPFEN